MIEHFRRQTDFLRACVADVLKSGDTAIDATVGTGEDTRFLADCVGKTGKVVGFDIQKSALESARGKLQGCDTPVDLQLESHDKMAVVLKDVPNIKAVMFNLGYLPGGDHDVTTKCDTTMMAVRQAAELLAPGGILTICAYEHAEGKRETQAVANWTAALGHEFDAYRFSVANHHGAPVAFVILKK